jgi:D-sedoheptulose 7-phosphate isomerase
MDYDEYTDPKTKNIKLTYANSEVCTKDYFALLNKSILELESAQIQRFVDDLYDAGTNNKTVFIAGNGGSSSIAEHASCDLIKGTFVKSKFSLSVCSLVSNGALISAISNDYGHDKIFSFQLEALGKEGDLLVLISSSGNSENLINAVRIAKAMNIKTIALTGFDGGILSKIVDLSLHVAICHYGIVEDAHSGLFHIATDAIQRRLLI